MPEPTKCPHCGITYDADENHCCASVYDKLVDAFLQWPLPVSVCADLCATRQGPGRVGTNLLSAVEAKQMFQYVLAKALNVHAPAVKSEPPPLAESLAQSILSVQQAAYDIALAAYGDPNDPRMAGPTHRLEAAKRLLPPRTAA